MICRRLCTVSAALFIVACPAEDSQVEHLASLDSAPDIACVWERLLQIAKWPTVQTIRDDIPLGVHYRFIFETRSTSHALGILIGNDGSFTYRNTAGSSDLTVPALRAAQQSLLDVDKALEGQCGIGALADRVRFACHGKNCDQPGALVLKPAQ